MKAGKRTSAAGYAALPNSGERNDISWDDFKYILAVAETKSFNQAALKLETDQTTVGRRITRVEKAIGKDLFTRTRSGTEPTQEGKRLIEEAISARYHFDRALNKVRANEDGNREIKIALTEGLATFWLSRFIPWFIERNPELTLRVFSQDKIIEDQTEIYDCQLQLVQPTGHLPMVMRVATLHYMPYASRAYEKRRGCLPKTREELVDHNLVDLSGYLLDKGNWINWTGDARVADSLTLFATSSSFFVESVRQGAGIALLPTYLSCLYDDLIPLELGIHAAAQAYLVYRGDRRTSYPSREAITLMRHAFNNKRMPWFGETYVEPSSFHAAWCDYDKNADPPSITAP